MKKDIQVYIHIPFCIHRCAYCTACTLDGGHAAKTAYLAALERELDAALPTLSDYRVADIEVGGGSPSCVSPDDLAALIRRFKSRIDLADYAEVCIEMVPQTVGTPSLTGLGTGKFNRVSLSMQSALDSELSTLDCGFSVEQLQYAILFLDRFRYNNLNLDLMAGIPGQTERSWKVTLDAVKAFEPSHVSIYPFSETADPDAVAATAADDPGFVLDADLEERLIGQADGFLTELGFERYTRYHWAKMGHTSAYVLNRLHGMDFLGFGLGARSMLDGISWANTSDWNTYIKHSGDFEQLVCDIIELSDDQKAQIRAEAAKLLI